MPIYRTGNNAYAIQILGPSHVIGGVLNTTGYTGGTHRGDTAQLEAIASATLASYYTQEAILGAQAEAAGAVDGSVEVTGVSAQSSIGTVSAFGTAIITLTGVSGQSAIGTVTAHGPATVAATGVSAAVAIGSVTATGTAQTTIEGVAATGTIGDTTAVGASATAPVGVSATSAIGTVVGQGSAVVAVTGVAATGAIGTATAGVPGDVTVSGVAVEAAMGTVTATGTARVVITGVSASSVTGMVTFPQAPPVEPPGDIVVGGGGGVAPPWMVLVEHATVRVRGVRARASVGRVAAQGDARAIVLGVEGSAAVGTVDASGTAVQAVRSTEDVRQVDRSSPVLVSGSASIAVQGVSAVSAVQSPDPIDRAWTDLQRQIDEEDELLMLGMVG